MSTRRASCSCGQLSAEVTGDPVRISVCHCLACQRRTGSAFGAQARWPEDRVRISGTATKWTRTADSGKHIDFHFCPTCGATLYYELEAMRGTLAIPLGTFADPTFPEPTVSVYETRRHPWVRLETNALISRHD